MKIFFDGKCPICSREIRFYKRKALADRFEWVDVCDISEASLPVGYSRQDLLKRFHVQHPTDGIVSGALAFALLWQELFGWRWMVRVIKLPVISGICELGYRMFLFLRHACLQRISCGLDTGEAR